MRRSLKSRKMRRRWAKDGEKMALSHWPRELGREPETAEQAAENAGKAKRREKISRRFASTGPWPGLGPRTRLPDRGPFRAHFQNLSQQSNVAPCPSMSGRSGFCLSGRECHSMAANGRLSAIYVGSWVGPEGTESTLVHVSANRNNENGNAENKRCGRRAVRFAGIDGFCPDAIEPSWSVDARR